MIKAIIFDCFGVLTSDGWLPFKQKHFGLDPEKFEEAGRINYLADSGKISKQQFAIQVAELANVSVDEVNVAIEGNVTNIRIFKLISDLKSEGYRIGMLSNVSGDWLDRLFTQDQIELFDALALSYDTGVAKPDKRAYEVICERLNCKSEEAVFIDDQERFTQGAVLAGMSAIIYSNLEQLETDLAKVLKMSDTDK